MPVITRIARIEHPGVLRDFTWSKELPDFSRYNLIYGWNGSGKTTISELFRALERRRKPEGLAQIVIGGAAVDGDRFRDATVPMRVFNRQFIAESVFPVDGGDIPPIFVLGKESAEKQARVEQLKQESAASTEALETARAYKKSAEKQLDRHCASSATIIREKLRSSGNNPYNNYDKRRYRERAEQMLANGNNSVYVLSDEARDRLLAQSHALPKDKISKIRYRVPDLKKYQKAASELLEATVVSSAIAALKGDANLARWIRQGLGIHQERDAEECLFCEQPLPGGRISQLEAHFNEEYERLLQKLDDLIGQVKREAETTTQLALPDSAKFYDDLVAEYTSAAAEFVEATGVIEGFLNALADELERKKQRVFEVNISAVSMPDVENTVVERANSIVKAHNEACDAFDHRVRSAREALEKDVVADSLQEYQSLQNDLGHHGERAGEASDKIHQIKNEISNIERDIIQHRQPAEELNEDLYAYLGHQELRLDVKETGYIISRSDGPARSLSEGERTAIALLYFLKSLQDRDFALANGVVVLDDPVSSLDANALYLAFAFIRHHVEEAGQIFLLTHNFSFFRQVRNWFHHLKGQQKNDLAQRPARFYMLSCTLAGESRRSVLEVLDPLLERFESEYHYLFAAVYRRVQSGGEVGLEANYAFPNMARRLLETFLAFRQPERAGELARQLRNVSFDEAKKMRILRFLHTHSHADAIAEPEHDPSRLAEAHNVLKDLLELIQWEDPAHFDAMVSLVREGESNDREE